MDQAESLSDVPVEGVVEAGPVGIAANPLPPGLMEEEAEELRTELTKVGPHAVQKFEIPHHKSQTTENCSIETTIPLSNV